jgi:hypothetical protein
MIRFSPSPPNHSKKEIDKINYSKYCSLKFHCQKSLVLICQQIYTALSDIWCKFSFFLYATCIICIHGSLVCVSHLGPWGPKSIYIYSWIMDEWCNFRYPPFSF